MKCISYTFDYSCSMREGCNPDKESWNGMKEEKIYLALRNLILYSFYSNMLKFSRLYHHECSFELMRRKCKYLKFFRDVLLSFAEIPSEREWFYATVYYHSTNKVKDTGYSDIIWRILLFLKIHLRVFIHDEHDDIEMQQD